MTLTIGRFGLDLAAGTVASTDTDGGTLKITGRTAYSDMEQARALEQQILGYVDHADESFVPVTWDETPQIDGFYRVSGASVGGVAGLAPAGVLNFSVTLVRVQGFAAPLIEDVVLGTARPSALGVLAQSWVGFPASARSFIEYRDGDPGLGGAAQTRKGEDGRDVVVQSGIADSCVVQYYVAPDRYYDAASTLQVASRTVAGRQVPNNPTEWLLSNGILQVRLKEGSSFTLEYRAWKTDGWSTWHTLRIGSSALKFPPFYELFEPHTITVLRNSPEMVVIRLVTTARENNIGSRRPVTVDIALRRGARIAAVHFQGLASVYLTLRLGDFNGADAKTGGYTKTLGPGNAGEVLVFASPTPVIFEDETHPAAGEIPVDLGPDANVKPAAGGVHVRTDGWSFGFGMSNHADEFNSDTLTYDRAIREYFWAGTDKQTVVAQ
ncbi:hypothetical protein [Herbiconiux solani]|uniref:hypothetical protein n=1 Tax=Herbiconiux solani TaxID=661329 RepID=UPI000826B862|nr:hypothetical protein [Herbiconiux solani]